MSSTAKSSPNVLAIIQARSGSQRLPGKPLLDLAGRPMLSHVIERMRQSRLASESIVATTIQRDDLQIVRLCAEMGIRVYCGIEEDPLERYYQAARLFEADHIIRIKSDCPLIDAGIIDQAIKLHLEQGADYTSNTLERTYPVGLDVEIMSRPTLEQVWKKSELFSERNHVTHYIAKHPDLFRICHVKQDNDLSGKRWTIDYSEDYEIFKQVFERLYPQDPTFGMQATLDYFAGHPELEKANAHIPVDAGIRDSIAKDRPMRPTS